jgi:hypothetical protein
MSNDTFQIIVMVALIFISIEIYYFYRYLFKSSDAPSKNKNNDEISNDKIYEIIDDIDYRLDRINTKINELMNVIMNGMIVNDENKDADQFRKDTLPDQIDQVDQVDQVDHTENVDQVHEVHEVENVDDTLNEHDNILFDKNEMLTTEMENNIENKMFEAIKSHVSELNYDGLDISDLPKTEDLQDPQDLHDLHDLHDLQSGGTSINEEIDENIKILEPINDETQKNINVVKRILN